MSCVSLQTVIMAFIVPFILTYFWVDSVIVFIFCEYTQKRSGVTGATFVFVFSLIQSQSTAMVMSGRSVYLTIFLSLASLTKWLTSTSFTYFHL